MHVIVLTTATTEASELPKFDETVLDLPPVEIERPKEVVKGDNEEVAKEPEVLSENEDIDAPKIEQKEEANAAEAEEVKGAEQPIEAEEVKEADEPKEAEEPKNEEKTDQGVKRT